MDFGLALDWISVALGAGVAAVAVTLGLSLFLVQRLHRAKTAWREEKNRLDLDIAVLQSELSEVPTLRASLEQCQIRIEKLGGEAAGFKAQADRIPNLEEERLRLAAEKLSLTSEISELRSAMEERGRYFEGRIVELTTLRGEIQKDFKNLASEALQTNQNSFLGLANEVMEKHRVIASTDLDERKKAIELLLGPVSKTLEACQENLTELERNRIEAYSSITTELKQVISGQQAVRTETTKLVSALRGAPKTRGRWGEHSLRNVLELAGLIPHCDFETEKTVELDGESLRPDVLIRMPGGHSLVVDAKAPLTAFLDALDATDERERERLLDLHAEQVKSHVKQLGSKAYWETLGAAPDFVVMYVPGDNFYSAATERDPQLFENAIKQKVVITTPATLVALARVIAFGWRQEKVAENAKRVAELGRELYRRMSTMTDHAADLGTSLHRSVKKYNDFVGSLESSVVPQARKFRDLEVEGTSTEIPLLTTIDTDTRTLKDTSGREGILQTSEPSK